MKSPEAVRKYDGRVVAYDVSKLAGSIARAACAAMPQLAADASQRLGIQIAQAVGPFLTNEGRTVPATADIRAMAIKLLRQTRHDPVADAYLEYGRAASSLLWGLRVVEPDTPFTSGNGAPWDRRRLLESLRAAGLARDPAGEIARDVERRIVALGQERISPALIHALGALVLAQRGHDVRTYNAKRIGFSMVEHTLHFDPLAGPHLPLAPHSAALEAFWLQAVHSWEVVRGVRENILALAPYALGADSVSRNLYDLDSLDPLLPQAGVKLRAADRRGEAVPVVVADTPERIAALSRELALLAGAGAEAPKASAFTVLLKIPRTRSVRVPQSAPVITLNVAGLVVREALHNQQRVTVRLAQLATLASLAHRQREEYFNLSPVRGRTLPVAVVGLWNAAAWLQGEHFDNPRLTRFSRTLVEMCLSAVRGALDTLRDETGMDLRLTGCAPPETARELWRRDGAFFAHDGVTLGQAGIYESGPVLRLWAAAPDLSERLDFARELTPLFDDPPAVSVEAPLGTEPDPGVWRELLTTLANAGVPHLKLLPGGNARSLRYLARAVQAHVEGLPLFEQK